MVTLRRDVKTETERYGGYNTGISSATTNYDRFRMAQEDELLSDDYVREFYDDSEEYKSYLWDELQRTSPRRLLSPEELRSGVSPEAVERVETTYTPQFTSTPAFAQAPASEAKSVNRDNERAQGLTFKAKLLIVAYVAVVVFFLTLIFINAGTLASLNSQIATLEASQSVQVEQGEVGSSIVDSSTSTSEPTTVYAGDYEMMSVTNPVNYDVSSNWFDSMCDWLGGVVGG